MQYVKNISLPHVDDPTLNRALEAIDQELNKIARVFTIDWTVDAGANNIHDNNILSLSITQHEGDIDHDALTNFDEAKHFLQSAITTVGTIGTGVWQGTAIGWSYISKTGSNLTDLATRQHAGLTNVTANQHHAQSHTLASHSTKPHSALTNITINQHHDKIHASTHHSGGGDPMTFANIAGFSTYLDQAVKQASSPIFVTAKLSALTDGYVPYHVSDALGLANSPIFTDGAKVGIGTASPQKSLHISHGIPSIRLSDTNATNDQQVAGLIEFYRGDTTNRVGYVAMDSTTNNILALATDYTNGEIRLRTGNAADRLTIDKDGNVGIGTTNLLDTLNIEGSVRFIREGVSTQYLQFTENAATTEGHLIEAFGTKDIQIKTPSGRHVLLMPGSSVGIGKAPTEKLDVDGKVLSTAFKLGSYELNSLIANNKVPDSNKWDGYQFADYLDQAVKQASAPKFYDLSIGYGRAADSKISWYESTTERGKIWFDISTNNFFVQALENDLLLEAADEVGSVTVMNDTNPAAANMGVGTVVGRFFRSTSAMKYKDKIKDLELDSSLIYNLRPISFNSTCKNADKNRRWIGLVADEVEQVYPEIVHYNKNNEVEDYDNKMLITLMLKEIQKLNGRVSQLEN